MSGHKMKQTTRGLEDTHLSEVQDYLKEHAVGLGYTACKRCH